VPKIISECCELVKLCDTNCSGLVFFETHCSISSISSTSSSSSSSSSSNNNNNNNNNNRETTFLYQRISVLLFRFNSVLLHNSFELDDRSEH